MMHRLVRQSGGFFVENMASLERFVYKITKHPIEQIGTVVVVKTDPNKLIATRPFLSDYSPRNKRRRASPSIPEGILLDGNIYVVDGHNKAKRKSSHNTSIECKVLLTENPVVRRKVERMKQCPIQDIGFR